eukprot:Skav234551  [mRNA]  locus=scaffold2556:403336:403587:+ [translate_table: standard]
MLQLISCPLVPFWLLESIASVASFADELEAALRGIAVNQDGMSSTMTAPNGPSQTLVVQTALVEAKMTHHEAMLGMACWARGM